MKCWFASTEDEKAWLNRALGVLDQRIALQEEDLKRVEVASIRDRAEKELANLQRIRGDLQRKLDRLAEY